MRRFFVLFFALFLFISCDFDTLFKPDFDDGAKEYLEYWSSTCQVAKVEFSSAKTTINGVENLSAKEQIQIDVFAINPKGFKLLQKNEGQCFSLQNSGGTLSYSDYSETQVDPACIKITAKLTDASEGQTITLSGGLYPENRTGWSESQLKESAPELFTSVSFIQNTPPDNIKNLNVPEGTFSGTLKHYVSFDVPDQSLNRNKDSTYEVSYYLRESDGSVVYKGKKTLTLDDNKGTSPTNFIYYFDGQEDYLNYEYTVQVIGPRGLKSEIYSTIPGLGVNELNEPTITVADLNGLKDDDDYECVEVESENDTVSFTVVKASEGDILTVTVDGTQVSSGSYTVNGIGQHTIVAKSSKDGSRPITVTKKIRIVTAQKEPTYTASGGLNVTEETNRDTYIEAEASTEVSYTITAESGCTLTVKNSLGNTTAESNENTHTLTFESLNSDNSKVNNLTVIVKKQYCTDKTFTKKVTLVKSIQEPTITVADLNGLKDEDDYECVEVENESDAVSFTVVKASDEETLTVTVDGSEVASGSYTVSGIGRYTIVAKSNKYGCLPVTVTKKIRIVKKLTEPKIEFTNASSIDGDIIKFSYLTYDTLFMDITNTYPGATITTTIDGGTAQTGDLTGQQLDVGTHTIKVTVEKEYCKPVSVEKNITVEIKQVYVAFENTKFRFHGADEGSGNKFDLRGTLCGETDSTARQILKTWNSGKVSKSAFDVTNVDKTFVLQSPTEKFYFYSDGYLYDLDGNDHQNIGKLDKGNTKSTRTLKELKTNKTFTEVGDRTSGGYFNCTFTLVLSEVSNASFFFTPALNGLADSNGYECVEVENSADTVSYKISCLESGVSLSGTVDGSSFSGTKTGTLGIGEHTLFAKCTATGSGSSTVTRKIKVVQKLQEPTVRFYKHSGNDVITATSDVEESGYSDYECYNLPLTTSGTGSVNFEITAGSEESVTVTETVAGVETEIAADSSGKRYLELGPHTLTIAVSKTGYTTREFTKKVYIQGTLSDPTLEFKAKDSSSDYKTVSQDGTDNGYPLYKFSYIYNDTMQICSAAGNSGNAQVIKVDGSQVGSGGDTLSVNGWLEPDTTPKITIVQTRQYCKTNTYEKTISVKIKPIKLWYRNGSAGGLKGWQAIYIKNFGTNNYDLYGDVFTKLNSGGESVIFSYGESKYPITANTWDHLNSDSSGREVVYICTSPNDKITLRMNNMRRRNHTDEGSVTGEKERTLSDIKNGTGNYYSGAPYSAWTLFTGKIGDYAEIGLTFDVSEVSE